MSDFARLAAQSCPPHEALATELAVELGVGASGASAARRTLDALRDVAARALRPRREGPYLLPEVLREGGGHPVGIAVALAALGARAGWQTALVGHHLKLYVAHRELAPVLVVDPARVEALVDPRTLGEDLAWRCAHEATGVVLRHVTAAAERSGDLTRSLSASALLLALPVDESSRAAQSAVHQRLLSRLN